MATSHVEIDPVRCINCGRCIEIARFGGITYEWDATPEHFRSVVTTHAGAVLHTLHHRVVCMNVLNLPPEEDGRRSMTILFSRDPVAVDAAAMDIAIKHKLLNGKEGDLASKLLTQAEETGLGRRRYFTESIEF